MPLDLAFEILDGFPLIVNSEIAQDFFCGFRFSPGIGDLDNDGNVDFYLPTSDSSLIFVNLPGNQLYENESAVPFWRYNQSMNNIGIAPPYTPVDVDERKSIIPEEFSLGQNFPNPFNLSTKIGFSIPARGDVKISIYNILGRKIRTLIDKTYSAGSHTVVWDGTDGYGSLVASGIYFYNIKSGEFNQTRKMTLVK